MSGDSPPPPPPPPPAAVWYHAHLRFEEVQAFREVLHFLMFMRENDDDEVRVRTTQRRATSKRGVFYNTCPLNDSSKTSFITEKKADFFSGVNPCSSQNIRLYKQKSTIIPLRGLSS